MVHVRGLVDDPHVEAECVRGDRQSGVQRC